MAKGATKRSRRVVKTGPASLGAAAALDSARYRGTKPLNADQRHFKPGRNNRSFTHSKVAMAPISRGSGLKSVQAPIAAKGAHVMSGSCGPFNKAAAE